MLAKLRRWIAALLGRTGGPRLAPEPHALDAVCAKYRCRYERSVSPSGEVQMRLIRDDATLSAVGLTTAAAVEAITRKAHSCWGTL